MSLGTWYYRVVAFDAAGNRTPSSQVSLFVSDVTPPTVPGNVSAVGGAQTAAISWSPSTDNIELADYIVYRSATANFTPSTATALIAVSDTSFSDTPPGNGTWYYRVAARDTAGNMSAPSAQVSALIADVTPPTQPDPVSGTTTGETVNLSWPASTDDAVVAGYDVYRSDQPGTAVARRRS